MKSQEEKILRKYRNNLIKYGNERKAIRRMPNWMKYTIYKAEKKIREMSVNHGRTLQDGLPVNPYGKCETKLQDSK